MLYQSIPCLPDRPPNGGSVRVDSLTPKSNLMAQDAHSLLSQANVQGGSPYLDVAAASWLSPRGTF